MQNVYDTEVTVVWLSTVRASTQHVGSLKLVSHDRFVGGAFYEKCLIGFNKRRRQLVRLLGEACWGNFQGISDESSPLVFVLSHEVVTTLVQLP